MIVHAELLGFGKEIGVAWDYEGKRDSVCIPNPHWPEINRRWHEEHPRSLPCATPDCEYCKC
jgi:hypothetical protein